MPTVIVMQATKDGEADDLSRLLQVIWSVWLARDTLLDALVGSGAIEVGLILLHGPIEMALAQDQEVVEASSAAARPRSRSRGRRAARR